jgi:hypothetical protein
VAETPEIKLRFDGSCPDCGVRELHLPAALPETGDDFDWRVRDYDGYRMFMLEELAARFPERTRWTPADLEVVLVEVMAALLDQLSDMLDRVAAEAFLESARQPETVRQLLHFIGYDAIAAARAKDQISGPLLGTAAESALDDYWRSHAHAMEQARRAGPREIHTQKRMVTAADYALRLREHPLVENAHAWAEWSGSWFSVHLAVIAVGNIELDSIPTVKNYTSDLQAKVINFHEGVGIAAPDFKVTDMPTLRRILRPYLDAFRMVGQEVILRDPVYAGIYLLISVKIGPHHFQSEIRHAAAEVLGHGPEGFFMPGKHGFGEDLYLSDVIEALMQLDGIEHVCLNRFKRVGDQYRDRVQAGFIALHGLEVARCDNDAASAKNGYYRLKLHGGRRG